MALNLVVLIMSIFKNSMPKYQKYMWGHIRGVRKMGSRGLKYAGYNLMCVWIHI
jgi:hypothetical protein